jgi:hypothetical protein
MGLENFQVEKPLSPRHALQLSTHSIHWRFIFEVFINGGARILRHLGTSILHYIQRYLYSLDSPFALGLLSSAAAALISHKIMIISLHSPLFIWGLILTWPCLFEFDLITLILLHWGLSSRKEVYKWGTGVSAIAIMLLSSSFASLYVKAHAELKWERAIEVISS